MLAVCLYVTAVVKVKDIGSASGEVSKYNRVNRKQEGIRNEITG